MTSTDRPGVAFPKDETGKISTTAVNKRIWAAVARAVDEDVAKGIESENKWRFKYADHLTKVGDLSMASPEAAFTMAQAGMDAVYDSFEFNRDGKTTKLAEVMASSTVDTFHTATITGTESAVSAYELEVPLDGEMLKGDALVAKLKAWAEYGCMEPSVPEAIEAVNANLNDWLAKLKSTYFVLLGATSAMGPLKALLALGANVVAVNRGGASKWAKLIALARESPGGSLTIPLSSPFEEGMSDEQLSALAGADLIAQTPEIRNWVTGLFPDKNLFLHNLIYLDGEAHVRASVAMDAVCSSVAKSRGAQVSLGYLGSPATVHSIPKEAYQASVDAGNTGEGANAFKPSRISWWHASLSLVVGGFKQNARLPVSATDGASTYYVTDGIVNMQGPNYALAKTMQMWRAILLRKEGHVVSANMAPGCRTESVCHNKQAAAGLEGFAAFKPMMAFDSQTVSPVMAALILYDLQCPTSASQPTVSLANPWQLFESCAWHGGGWRCAYNIDSIGKPSYLLGVLGGRRQDPTAAKQ
jgi:hypothetical protein